MERVFVAPRPGYREKIEALGFDFHGDYWREEACYRLSSNEVEMLETATAEAYRMYCDAVEYILNDQPEFMERILQLPPEICERIRRSWDEDELSLYGRFDFLVDKSGVPRILEFNADTPTSLLEASVIQWQWKEDLFPASDQYNGIHEGLVQSWKDMFPAGSEIHFAGALDDHEDTGTLQYLASTAMEAGFSTRVLDMNSLDLRDGCFYDPSGERVKRCFKLYPWEWMVDESADGCLADVQWVEPVWKLLMSNKAILKVLFDLFPDSPYVLPCYLSRPESGLFCKKPVYSREGHNVSVLEIRNWEERVRLAETEGDYNKGAYVYQEYVEPTAYSGRYPVIGSWVVGGEPAGIGIRENRTEITGNLSEFVPHIIG
ncbi:glutathionylspermidine synthase family protein [Bacteroides gallinaceum]|uniref:Glutathionylspermidine synthase family protein n=1 Tax=Bacteroides gallinaceum TaxID=1462571 RepID=A0ABT7VFU7_9BACE|nr:glutathionylspermidine synthase family protein [Bacteroides gallinaceum]MDM8325139.1 glutathionylspermidine synthase family protein [Bacteroides gallinaceum]